MRFAWPCILLFAVAVQASPTNDLLAHFRLAVDGSDVLGRNPAGTLRNASIVDGALYLNGRYEHSGRARGYRATFPIGKLDYNSFTVALDFYPLGFKPDGSPNAVERKLNFLSFGHYWRWFGSDRSDNANILTGGTSHRWLGFHCETNTLQLTLNNQRFQHSFTGVPIKPKCWHNLICSVDVPRRTILILLDGQLLDAVTLPEDFVLNVIGSEAEATDREFSFANYSNGSAYYGRAANLEVFGHALTETELAAVHADSISQRAALKPMNESDWPAAVVIPLTAGAVLSLGLAFLLWKRSRGDRTCQ